ISTASLGSATALSRGRGDRPTARETCVPLACGGTGTVPRAHRIITQSSPTRRRVEIMWKSLSPTWLLGGWFAAVAVIVAWSVALDARLSTSALLLLIGVAPAVVMVLIGPSAPAPTVAEILHSVNTTDGR